MGTLEDRFETATSRDVFIDYCHWPYTPSTGWLGKFRSVNLLLQSFGAARMDERAVDLVQALRQGFGIGETVWGVKWQDGRMFWELYVYDYRRRERTRSMSRFLEILHPFAHCDIRPDENLPYFMFSVDVTADLVSGTGPLERLHMYIGNPGSTVSSGICYALEPSRTSLENFYFFFDAGRQLQDATAKAACSAHLDATRLSMDAVFPAELARCKTICVANKQANDSIYFSRVDVDQLLFFLRTLAYPPDMVSFVDRHRADLDHLLFDVGFDYRMEGGELRILKSGYYGFF